MLKADTEYSITDLRQPTRHDISSSMFLVPNRINGTNATQAVTIQRSQSHTIMLTTLKPLQRVCPLRRIHTISTQAAWPRALRTAVEAHEVRHFVTCNSGRAGPGCGGGVRVRSGRLVRRHRPEATAFQAHS